MRVLHVITRLSGGGAQANTVATAVHHRRAGVESEILFGSPRRGAGDAATNAATDAASEAASEADLVAQAEAGGVPLHRLPGLEREPAIGRDLRALVALVRFLRSRSRSHSRAYDVLHTHTSKAGFLGRLAARLAGQPAVVVHTPHGHVFHGYDGPVRTSLYVALERVAASWASRIVALTPSERDEHLAIGIGDRRRFVVVPSGIDLARFAASAAAGCREAARARLGAAPGDLVVGCIGRLAPIKGQATLIRALPRLLARFPTARLHLLGDGGERAPLGALACGLGVDPTLRLHGRVADPALWIGGFDVLAVPSRNEGMGRVVIEAMAAGVPIVASAVGGIPDLVEHGRTALLVPPGDVPALAAALIAVATDPGAARARATAARAAAGPRFSTEAMASRLLEIYREALGLGL